MARGRLTTSDAPTGPEAADGGADDAAEELEQGPLRRCAVTRERLAKETMIRFVVAPDGTVVPDLAARLPGRGIWLSARADVIETARTRGVFAKAARSPVRVSPDLLSGLRAALLRRVGDHLGLARRAGQAVSGFSKAREWLATGRAALVVQAADGSIDERARCLGAWAGPVVTPLDGLALGAMFGRDHAVHVAIAPGRLAERIRGDAGRLAGLDVLTDGAAAGGKVGGPAGDGFRRDQGRPRGSAGRIEKVQAGR